jgi:hypothetical protein
MTVIISGDNGVSDVDGSVGTPAVRGTDANTGIYFPAANQVAVSCGGVRSLLMTDNGAFLETNSIPATINSLNSNAYKVGFQDNGVARGFVGANSANAFKVANASATDVLNVTSAGVLQMNSGYGSVASAYGVRAWGNIFNSAGTISLAGSGGISSVTDNGVGQYTPIFSFTMPDANYAVAGISQNGSGSNSSITTAVSSGTETTTSFQFTTKQGSSFVDTNPKMFLVVR